jgi:hypothetical protein
MAYETLLNTPALIKSVDKHTINTNTLSGTIVFDLSATTLGDVQSDENAKLSYTLGFVPTLSTTRSALSATSVVFTLSSATAGNSNTFTEGTLVSSQFATNSARFTVSFPNSRDLLTTVLSFSANASTIVIDTTETSVIDNFFYLNDALQVRTTAGHSRLVSYLG